MTTQKPLLRHRRLRLLAASAFTAFTVVSLPAEDVFVSASLGTTAAFNNVCPPSCFSGSVSSSGSSAFSSATPQPPQGSRRSRFGFANGCTWSVQPDAYPAATLYPNNGTAPLQSPGVYKIYATLPANTSCSQDIVVNMTVDGSNALADKNGIGAVSVPVTAFAATNTIHTWIHIGYITNTVANPIVTFTYASSTVPLASAVRWYMDTIRFENIGDPCYGSGATQVGVTGPLAAGGTNVTVTGVTAGATNVTVYANAVEIGATNFAGGFAAGTVIVPVTPMNQNDAITATQSKSGCTSQPSSSALVGGGPNAQLRAFVTGWKNSTNAGPIGASSSAPTSGFFYMLGATGLQAGFGSAPLGGRTLPPGACWQYVSFQNGVDDAIDSNSGGHVTNNDTFSSLEGMIFAIDASDNGPYDIYVDQIMNGDTVVEDFESYADGSTSFFAAPNAAALPVPGAVYFSQPNSSTISSAYAFGGSKSCRLQWQWKDASSIRWAHIVANATAAKRFPQIDRTKPITARVLVLPVGGTTAHVFNGTVSEITNSAPPIFTTQTNVLGVTVTGGGTYTYQWSWSGGGLPNPSTDRTYTIDGGGSGASSGDNGTYTVQVSDGTCTETRSINFTVADPIPTITNQPDHAIILAGNTAAVMSVGATGHVPAGYPLTYLWRSNGVDITDQTLDTLWITNASLADVLDYDVVVANSYGSVTSSIAKLSVTTVGPGTGTGLKGDYYTLHFPTNYVPFTGAPTASRTDATVDFDWGNGSPIAGVSPDNFTARWYGSVQALGNDDYTFHTVSDDGVRLWVNGQLLVDNWTTHAPTTNTGTITLSGTTQYPVILEYFEQAVSAVARLYWSSTSGSIQYQPVPMTQLSPATFVSPTVTLNSPANLTTNTLPVTVGLSATVVTNSGLVDKVQFLTNGVVLAETATPPYTYSWVNPPAAVYDVSARAVFNLSSGALSATSLIEINQILVTPVTSLGINGGTLNYSGGAGSQFVLLKSTDIAAGLANWTRVATNSSTPGSFAIPVGSEPKAFYAIKSE